MPYVQRQNGVVTGVFPCIQQGIAEEFLADSNPEVIAYLNPVPDPRLVTDEQERKACAIDNSILPLVNQTKAEWTTWAGANFPTLAAAERTRLGVLFWVVSVGVRRSIRTGA